PQQTHDHDQRRPTRKATLEESVHGELTCRCGRRTAFENEPPAVPGCVLLRVLRAAIGPDAEVPTCAVDFRLRRYADSFYSLRDLPGLTQCCHRRHATKRTTLRGNAGTSA